jgi:thioredoxin reductase
MTDQSAERPFPPGEYPVVVVGSGPGGLQTSYCLRRLGLEHAVISSDEAPGGMFRRFPLFQRLISWTKPHAPVERGTRPYEWYDWNSLLAEDPSHAAPAWEFMDGSSYFPARPEMEAALRAFADRAGVRVRYGCTWEATRRDEDGFTLITSDGEYRCRIAIFAVGMTRPWKPDIPGIDQVPHYAECRQPAAYGGRRVFVIGKRNSAFELADGLLPHARQVILGSPSPAKLSVMTRSWAGARARYAQPYEDHVLVGGTLVLDAVISKVERGADGYRLHLEGTTIPASWTFEVDEAVAATGFDTPLADLPDLGVATFAQGRLPVQTSYWESTTVPGIYFAGNVSQGGFEIKKHGMSSNSAAVHGFRYNARVLARHIARTHFGIEPARPSIRPDDVVDFLLEETARAPELWNQRSYLARLVTLDPDRGLFDEGIVPLAEFADRPGPDGVAVTLEGDHTGDVHAAVYVKEGGRVSESLLPSSPVLEYDGDEQRKALEAAVADLLRSGR